MISEIWHPNISPQVGGEICISFLIDPLKAEFPFLKPYEYWRPIYSVEMIIIQIMSMLIEPALEGAINVDAAIEFRENYQLFKWRAAKSVAKSQQDVFAEELDVRVLEQKSDVVVVDEFGFSTKKEDKL